MSYIIVICFSRFEVCNRPFSSSDKGLLSRKCYKSSEMYLYIYINNYIYIIYQISYVYIYI